jgi:hypothetical protein
MEFYVLVEMELCIYMEFYGQRNFSTNIILWTNVILVQIELCIYMEFYVLVRI